MPSPSEIQRNLIQRVNVGDSLTRTAARQPHALALVDGERRLTYSQFSAQDAAPQGAGQQALA